MTGTALIFGVSGQTGSYLAHLLLSKGYRVVGTSRDAEINSFSNLSRLGIRDRVQFRSISLSDFRSVLATIQEISPDEIYNLAGQSSVALSFDHPAETFESIAMATLNILECMRFDKRPARLFNATSSDCFGNMRSPAAENTAFRPQSPYAMAKAAAFWSVVSYRNSYDLFASNGILSNHESPLRPNRFVTRKIITTVNRIASGSGERACARRSLGGARLGLGAGLCRGHVADDPPQCRFGLFRRNRPGLISEDFRGGSLPAVRPRLAGPCGCRDVTDQAIGNPACRAGSLSDRRNAGLARPHCNARTGKDAGRSRARWRSRTAAMAGRQGFRPCSDSLS